MSVVEGELCDEARPCSAVSRRSSSSNGTSSTKVPPDNTFYVNNEATATCKSDEAPSEAVSSVLLQLLMRQYQSEHTTLTALVNAAESRANELQRELHAEQERTATEHDAAESLREKNAILQLEMQQHALQHSKECMELRDQLRRSEEEKEELRKQLTRLQKKKQQRHHHNNKKEVNSEQPLPVVHTKPALATYVHQTDVPQAKMLKSINGLSTEHDVSSTLTSLLSYCYSDRQEGDNDDDNDHSDMATRTKQNKTAVCPSSAVKLVQGAVLQKELRYYQRMISDMLAVMQASKEARTAATHTVSTPKSVKGHDASATRATRQLHAELLFMTTVQLPLLQREVARRGELLDCCHDVMSAIQAMCAAMPVPTCKDANNGREGVVPCSPRMGKSLPSLLRHTVHTAQADVHPRKGYYTMDSETSKDGEEDDLHANYERPAKEKTEKAKKKTTAEAASYTEADEEMHAAAVARCGRTMAVLRRLCVSEAQRSELHRRRHHHHHHKGNDAVNASGFSDYDEYDVSGDIVAGHKGGGGVMMTQYSARVQHTERQFANAKIDQLAPLALQTVQSLCHHMKRCRAQQEAQHKAACYATTQVERLEKMLDRCREERDEVRQELDSLRLVVDALNSERVRLRHERVVGN